MQRKIMNANELRLGNLVEQGKVRGVVNVRVFIDTEAIHISNIKPIELTEEILLKCKEIIKHPTIENRYLLKDSNYSFNIEDGNWDNPSLDVLINGMYMICVEYLHQFQNIIFALTNNELEINL